MPSVKCSLKDCSYRGIRGGCHRKHIKLQQADPQLNEMFCLGWATQETRLFTEVMNAEIDPEETRWEIKEGGIL